MTAKERDRVRLIDEDIGALGHMIQAIESGPSRIDYAVRKKATVPLLEERIRLCTLRRSIVDRRRGT